MENYRKTDQYYIDKYDRMTIERLKELEAQEVQELRGVTDPMLRLEIKARHEIGNRQFKHVAIMFARNRESTIRDWMLKDERQDRLVAQHPIPKGVTCDTCGETMQFCMHDFDVDGIPLLFFFECPQHHPPRKVLHPDGRRHYFPKITCIKCGHEVRYESYKANNILYSTTTCPGCEEVEKEEIHLTHYAKKLLPVAQEDRQKYCLSFLTARTFVEDLESLANMFESLDASKKEQELRELYGVDKIERLKIPAMESRIQDILEKAGFTKIAFDRPQIKTHTILPFSMQDPTDRDEQESSKLASTAIKTDLLPTNWRLNGQIDYRLGYLTGKLKAYESDEDLLKLAKEQKGHN